MAFRGGNLRQRPKVFTSLIVVCSALLLVGCGGGGGGSASPGAAGTSAPPDNWNDYVRASSLTTACDGSETGGYAACLHAGERQTFTLSGVSSCSGLVVSDNLDAFNWFCDDSGSSVQVTSGGLKPGMLLSDLIDFSAVAFKSNFVSTTGSAAVSTSPSIWWSNDIVEMDGSTGSTLDDASGTLVNPIYLFTSNSVDGSYVIAADHVGLVIEPGQVLTGVAGGASQSALSTSGGPAFLWIEGTVNGAGNEFTTRLSGITFSVVRGYHGYDANAGSFPRGLWIGGGAAFNKLSHIRVSNSNTGSGLGFNCSGCLNNTIYDLVTANNNLDGVVMESSARNNTFLALTALNNQTRGVLLHLASRYNSFLDVTIANTSFPGLNFTNTADVGQPTHNTFMNLATVNNGSEGVWDDCAGTTCSTADNTFANVLAAHNGGVGIRVSGGTDDYFTGLLKSGNNGGGDCSGSTGDGLLTSGCAKDTSVTPASDSTATTGGGVTATDAFLAKVGTSGDVDTTGDAVNPHDDASAGTASLSAITDWYSFENAYRGWGKNNTAAFPSSAHRGPCASGTCRIWDFSANSADVSGVLRGAISTLPTGDDTLNHLWEVDSDPQTAGLQEPNSQADCTAGVLGSTFVAGSPNTCQTTFLRNAVEVMDDGLGNENTLCETDETCLFTPNIGSYQGHGALVSAGAFVDSAGGGLTGITLVMHTANGR